MNRVLIFTSLSLCLALGLVAVPTVAADLATVNLGSGSIAWQPTAEAASWVLTVTGPEGFHFQEEFTSAPSMDLFAADGQLVADGLYKYELRAIPHISPQLRQELDAAAGNLEQRERLAARVQDLGGVQSGSFRIEQGSLVTADRAELGPETLSNATSAEVPTMELDQVFLDDVIVDGSLCVGFDCVNGESFGFDTIRLKENNLRIHFDDTSSSGSFPSNDWRLTANDSANGGLSRFTLEDATAGRNVFTIEAAARSNSLYVDSSGRVGIGTNNPVVEAHVSDGDSPALRLEQNGSSGFTPQTWDVAGNETNFFVRDVTNGSRLPFKIRPNAATNALVIDNNGDVRMGGGTSADASLHIQRSDQTAQVLVEETSATAAVRPLIKIENNGGVGIEMSDTSANAGAGLVWTYRNTNGQMQILSDAGGIPFRLTTGGNLTITGSLTANGSTFPDYVFEESYPLMPLTELASFITTNKHLPGIPPAREVEEQGGHNMTELQLRLLEKVEELTLYTLDQQSQIEELRKEKASLMARLAALEEVSD